MILPVFEMALYVYKPLRLQALVERKLNQTLYNVNVCMLFTTGTTHVFNNNVSDLIFVLQIHLYMFSLFASLNDCATERDQSTG